MSKLGIVIDAGDPITSTYAAAIEALHDQVQAELAARYLNQPTAYNPDATPITPHDDARGCGSSGGRGYSEWAAENIR